MILRPSIVPPPPPRKSAAGSALLLVLLVMSLMLVVAVAFSMFVTAQQRASRERALRFKVQQNAKTALMIAIGELQETAGPDTRITATSGIVEKPGGTRHTQHTVGVWRSLGDRGPDPANEDHVVGGDLSASEISTRMAATYTGSNRESRFIRWLMSDPSATGTTTDQIADVHTDLSTFENVTPGSGGLRTVTLVGVNTLNQDTASPDPGLVDDYVYAPVVDTDNGEGGYAWWIGDEGGKARINLEENESGTLSDGRKTTAAVSSKSPGVEKMDPALAGLNPADRIKLGGIRTLPLAEGSGGPSANLYGFFFDVTTTATGVRASTNGGLQRDLSLAMIRSESVDYVAGPADESKLLPVDFYRNNNPGSDFRTLYPLFPELANVRRFDGPSWMDVWVYSHHYRSVEDGGDVEWDNGVPMIKTMLAGVPFHRKYNWHKLYPQISKWSTIYSHERVPHNIAPATLPPAKAGTTHAVRLVTNHVYELYNPYNLDWESRNGEFMTASENTQPLRFKYTAGSETIEHTPLTFFRAHIHPAIQLTKIKIAGQRIPAGKALVFAPPYTAFPIHHKSATSNVVRGGANFESRDVVLGGGSGPAGGTYAFVRNVPMTRWGRFGAFGKVGRANTADDDRPDEHASLLVTNDQSISVEMIYNKDDHGSKNHGNRFGVGIYNANPGLRTHSVLSMGGLQDEAPSRYSMGDGDGRVGITGGVSLSRSGDILLYRESIPGAGQREPFCILTYEYKTEAGTNENNVYKTASSRVPFKNYIYCQRIAPMWYVQETANHSDSLLSTLLGAYAVNLRVDGLDSNWGFEADSSTTTVDFDPTNFSAYLGTSTRENFDGTGHVPMREIPITAISSMAQLQHAGLGDLSYATKRAGYEWGADKQAHFYYGYPFVEYAAGNGWGHPLIAPDQVTGSGRIPQTYRQGRGGVQPRTLYDKSWIINTALWDDYFYSSVGLQRKEAYGRSRDKSARDVLVDAMKETEDLPNSLYRFSMRGEDPELVADRLTDFAASDQGYKEIAKYIQSLGDFNVNSTSKLAWKGFFASLNQQPLLYLEPGIWDSGNGKYGRPTLEERQVDTPVSRFSLPLYEGVEGDVNPDRAYLRNRWKGARILSDDELDDLAEKTVEHVRQRGPFLSVADFLNRRLEASEYGTKGALQAAIDASTVNESFKQSSVEITDSYLTSIGLTNGGGTDLPLRHKATLVGYSGEGAPGYVTQADLLMPLGPHVKVRSDTFRIRAYGETRSPDNAIQARAWCEAILQRTVDYVDPSNIPETEIVDMEGNRIPDALESMNREFGRKFEIVSFRWLNEDEI